MNLTNSIGLVLCISGPFLALGIVFIIIAVNRRRKAQASLAWPAVPGVVVSAEVHETVHSSDEGADTYSYDPKIVYTYQVGGTEYKSHKYSFGASNSNRNPVAQIVARYTPGMAVSVHYNPEKPGEAVLQSEAGGTNIFLIIGIILTMIGVMIACAGIAAVTLAGMSTP